MRNILLNFVELTPSHQASILPDTWETRVVANRPKKPRNACRPASDRRVNPLQQPSMQAILLRLASTPYSLLHGTTAPCRAMSQMPIGTEPMSTLTPSFERYRQLSSTAGDTPVLVIDTQATPQALLDAAQQRIRAASNLLETFYCLCFNQADVKDIPHIVNALYLLIQDGSDVLEVLQQRLPKQN